MTSAFKVVDVHMHVIPGVDDGALDQQMALEMLQMAQEQGISTVFAAPHSSAFRVLPDETGESFRLLCDTAAQLLPGMQICLGCEIICEPVYIEQVTEMLRSGIYPTMNNTGFVLVEFTPGESAQGIIHCAAKLLDSGYQPILAHTERYIALQNSPETVEVLRRMGARVQVNLYSLAKEKNPVVLTFARQLVRMKKVDYLGTDAHRTYHRPPDILDGLQWLYQSSDKEYADALTWKNAARDLSLDQYGLK